MRMKTKLLLLFLCCNISLFLNAHWYFDYNGYRYFTDWYESDGNSETAYWVGFAESNPDQENAVVPTSVIYHYTKWVDGVEIHKSKQLTVRDVNGSSFNNLKTIYISDGIIGVGGFSDCPNLTSVYLGCGTIYYGSFNQCPSLTHITVGPNFKSAHTGGTSFFDTYNLKELTWNAICAERGRLDGGSTPTASVLQNLEKLTFGDQVEYIPPGVANYAVKLNHVTIPSSVTAIGDGAFYNSGLVDVHIPNSVVSIDNSVFSNCGNLTSVVMENSVTSLGNGVFTNCSNLRNVKLSNSLTSIPSNTFNHCTSLNKIVIPKQVRVIGDGVFRNCDSLKHVYLPDSLKEVQSLAFYDCLQLEHIYSPIKEPQNVNFLDHGYTFRWEIYGTCTIHVPKGTLPLYQELSPWNRFTLVDDYEQFVYTAGDVNCDGNVTSYDVTAIYNYLLNNDMTYINTLDVTGDGDITAADITALYSIMLGN